MLEEHGQAYLETWQVPMLTWDELQELKQLYEAAPISALESPLGGEQHDCAQQCLVAVERRLLEQRESCASVVFSVSGGTLGMTRRACLASVSSCCLSGMESPI